MASYKVQENIQAIVAIASQYKDSEPLGEVSNPFDINFGKSTLLQEKFETVRRMLSSGKVGVPTEPLEVPTIAIIKPKLVPANTENYNESLPGSLKLGLPDTSSINNSFISREDALSTAKLVFKLKHDPVGKDLAKLNLDEQTLDVVSDY